MKMPCELIVWYMLPAIRSAIAESMIKDYKLKQTEVAQKLGMTDAAISQYLSSKRGKVVLKDPKVKKFIKEATKRIVDGQQNDIFIETCKICDILKNSKFMVELYKEYGNGIAPKNVKNIKC